MAAELESQFGGNGQESPQTAIKKSKKKRKREKETTFNATVPIQNEELHEQSPMDVKFDAIYDCPDRTPPIVGYFPSGYRPLKNDDVQSLEEPSYEPIVKFYRNAQRSKIEKNSSEKNEKWRSSERLELVVSPKGSNVEFVGKSYKGEAMAAQLCTYALGVLDKKTQTLKIMPIAGNKILRLEPKVRGVDTTDQEPISQENKEDKARKLNQIFGSKRSVMQDKRAQALKRGDDLESQGELKNKIDKVVVNKEALESTSAEVARNIPPHNSSATTPQQAYPLNRIILTGEWDFLEDICEILQVGVEAVSEAYPVFVSNRIHKLQEIQDEEEKRTLSCIFSYITHLIKFRDLHSLDRASSAKKHKFPSILNQRFVQMFTPESRRLPVEKNDLLISYVLVLTLYADDFRTDPTDIAKDLGSSMNALRMHFLNLGCKFAHENKLPLATLPVPLKFPTLRQRRRRQ